MSWKRWPLRLAVGVASTWLLITVWLVGQRETRRAVGGRELAAVLAETSAAEPGWTWEALEPADTPPPDDAPTIAAVRALSPAGWAIDPPLGWERDTPDPPPNVRFAAATQARAGESLAPGRRAVEFARAALADRPAVRRRVELAPDVFNTKLPDTQFAATVTRLLRWDAVFAAEAGDRARLAAALAAALNASRSIGDEPFLVSQSIRMGARNVAAASAERGLAQVELNPGALERLQATWARDADEPLLLIGLRGDRAAFDAFFRNLTDGRYNPGGADGPLDRYFWWLDRGRLPRDHAFYLRWTGRALAAARLPTHEQLAAVRAIPPPDPADPSIRFSLLVLPAAEKMTFAALSSTGVARCTVAGVACERFRQERGHWPAKLNDLVPAFLSAVPLDPFTGEPLRLAKLNHGVVVYSVGTDGRGDGGDLGTPLPPAGSYPRFRLWNPDRRRLPPPEPPPPEPDP